MCVCTYIVTETAVVNINHEVFPEDIETLINFNWKMSL